MKKPEFFIVKLENILTFCETKHPTFAGGVSNAAYLQCPSNYRFYYNTCGLLYNWMRIKKQVLNPHQSTFKG